MKVNIKYFSNFFGTVYVKLQGLFAYLRIVEVLETSRLQPGRTLYAGLVFVEKA